MPMPQARSRIEAQLYMSLTPCPSCGEPDFDADVDVVQLDAPRILRYFGPCGRCGRLREFVFELADDEGPSTLIDAGEWLLISDLYHDSLNEIVESEQITEEHVPALHDALHTAAAAIDEVIAFVPAGVSRVPDEAFWTDRGMAVRHAVPERFEMEQLTAARVQRWREVNDFEDVHPAFAKDGSALDGEA